MAYRVMACHPLTRRLLARLNVNKPRWTEVVNGNGTLSGTITLPEDPQAINILRGALVPDSSAIYVQETNSGRMPFGGVLTGVNWRRNSRELAITAVDWRTWLYGVYLAPQKNMTGDIVYSWTNTDQLQIARALLSLAVSGGPVEGRPAIDLLSYPTSGQNRDLNLRGMDFVTVGEAIDRVSTRDNGFEWGIAAREGVDGLPALSFETYYPQRGGPVTGLRFSDDKNIIDAEDYQQDSSDRRTRVWALGEGSPNQNTPYAQDTDPAMSRGYTLLRETKTQYSSVINVGTLSSHARAERIYRNPLVELHTVTVNMNDPDVNTYQVGDRAELRIRDEWLDAKYLNARIIQREMLPGEGAGQVKVTFDLSDATLPEAN